MTFVALTIPSVIDAVLPYTNYDTSVIWITCTDLSDLLPHSSPESNWSYTCNAPNVRGATPLLFNNITKPPVNIADHVYISCISSIVYIVTHLYLIAMH